MDKQVNAYIEKQKSPQKEILQKVRKIFQKTLPSCEEKMVWGLQRLREVNSISLASVVLGVLI